MTNLFKGYAVIEDKQYVNYIADLKTQYEDGCLNMDADKLMMMGYQKFKNIGLSETLAAPAVEKTDIVALKAATEELMALKTTVEQLQQAQLGNKKPKNGDTDKWAWKAIAPKANQSQTKQVNSKTYHWCPNHVKWCIHTPADCKGFAKPTNVPTSVSGSTNTTNTSMTPAPEESSVEASKRKLELTNAFNAFILEADDGEDCI
jgi:hypothetical protein